MSDLPDRQLAVQTQNPHRVGLMVRLARSRKVQDWAARVPVLRRFVRHEGAAIFDLIQGFVQSQALFALVKLDVFAALKDGPVSVGVLARRARLMDPQMALLLQAGAAMKLLRKGRDGHFGLTLRGQSLVAAPGVVGMIRHHDVLYRDLADPVAFLRGQTEPELARFWPYVFGAGAAQDPIAAAAYSDLMSDSQVLVAADVLQLVSFRRMSHLLDIGGGTGRFLTEAAKAWPHLKLTLFDLPVVLEGAQDRLDPKFGVTLAPGSFRDDPLPKGADVISLVRVLYDHADETVSLLLSKVFETLPKGGTIVIAEPMSGGIRPDPVTDVYFSFYTAAMKTGRVRSMAQIAEMLSQAGFEAITCHPGCRSYITSAVSARKL